MPTTNASPRAGRARANLCRTAIPSDPPRGLGERSGRARVAFVVPGALALAALLIAALPVPAAEPVDVVFVLDNSGSMREHDPGYRTREAVVDFTAALAEQARVQSFSARVGIVLFDEEVTVALPLTPLVGDLADSPRAMLAPALSALDYSGQRTRSADGIERALYALRESKPQGGRQAIVFLTDGKLDTGDPARDREASAWLRSELAAEARDLGVRIFGLAFTERADYQLLQSVARQTDADYYRALRADELGGIAGRILARVTRATPVDPGGLAAPAAALPSVSSASPDVRRPAVDAAGRPAETAPGSRIFERLAWLPLALLGLAGALWSARRHLGVRRAARRRAATAPAAQLLDVGGVLGETGRAIPLVAGRTRIGRDSHNEVVIQDDTISSEHAAIELEGGRYWLEDLRSTNGTKHRDVRLAPGQRVALKVGDHVRFADVDLMFVAPGHVPGGATVVLPSTSTPPSHWRSAERSSGASGAAAQKPSVRDAARPLFDASTREVFRECLDYHLARVEELSSAFARFVARAFEEEMRAALCVAAGDLVKTAQREDRISERRYTHDRVRYVVCGAPGGMDVAARAHQSAHGGFTRFLTEQIDDESFRADRCEILAVLTFGRSAGAPWVTLSIVPDEGRDPQIDLLSFELLSEEERRAVQPDAVREISQTGRG